MGVFNGNCAIKLCITRNLFKLNSIFFRMIHMCGIYGYIRAKKNTSSQQECIDGLKSLEYRGYDSAGIAGIEKGQVFCFKSVGKVHQLEKALKSQTHELEVAIAHTRWATHGKVNELNTHPHLDHSNSIAIVHNGIIENHLEIRKKLEKFGIKFKSQTDSEVICQLLAYHYQGCLKKALKASSKELKGSFAIAAIHKSESQKIIATAHKSPLVIAYDKNTKECFVSSDVLPFTNKDLEIIYLENNEFAEISPERINVTNLQETVLEKKWLCLNQTQESNGKDGYEHYMLKEIHQQPQMVKKNLVKNIELDDLRDKTSSFDQIIFIGCGSSYHAANIVMHEIEKTSQKICRSFIASEFLYNAVKVTDKTLVIAISQSGETADTIAVVKNLINQCHVVAVTNSEHSSLVRLTKHHLFLDAGIEISVCSTKAFSAQVLNLLLLNNYLFAKKADYAPLVYALEKVLNMKEKIHELAIKYSIYKNFSFVARSELVASSQEAALKLKEISYLNANYYPSGEMKHGPIALIDVNHPTIALLQSGAVFDKNLSNLSEIKTRGGPILAFSTIKNANIEDVCDDIFLVPSTDNKILDTIVFGQALQLFAYFIAKELGTNIDQPKNLAKSVTVE